MNGHTAKKIRKEVYGDEFSPDSRNYIFSGKTRLSTGLRKKYQQIKKEYKQCKK